MADEQELTPRASRPLPERRSPERPLPPRALADRPLPARPLPDRQLPARRDAVPPPDRGDRRPTVKRPDPRPMRVVYGAGAVAAVSIMAVGLVQPNSDSATDPN